MEVGPGQEGDIGLEEEEDDDDGDNDADLISRLQRLFSRSVCVCTPHHEQKVSIAVSMSTFFYMVNVHQSGCGRKISQCKA